MDDLWKMSNKGVRGLGEGGGVKKEVLFNGWRLVCTQRHLSRDEALDRFPGERSGRAATFTELDAADSF